MPIPGSSNSNQVGHGGLVLTGTHGLCKAELGVRFPYPPPRTRLIRDSTVVVQLTVNQLVVGSIPTLGAR